MENGTKPFRNGSGVESLSLTLHRDKRDVGSKSQILKEGEVLAYQTQFDPAPLNNIIHAGVSKGNSLEDREIMFGIPEFFHQEESNLIMEAKAPPHSPRSTASTKRVFTDV